MVWNTFFLMKTQFFMLRAGMSIPQVEATQAAQQILKRKLFLQTLPYARVLLSETTAILPFSHCVCQTAMVSANHTAIGITYHCNTTDHEQHIYQNRHRY